MAINIALNHVTEYRYDRRINLGPQVIRLRPAAHSRTSILAYSLKVTPENHFINWQQDPNGNYLARLVFPEKTDHFRVEVDMRVEMSVINPFDFFLEPQAEHIPFCYSEEQKIELAPYLHCQPLTPELESYLSGIPDEARRSAEFLVAINQQLQQHIGYTIRMEPGVQTPEETLTLRSGSCRDSAWLLVQILRNLGLAARFVSGYLIQLTPDVKSLDGPSGPEEDFTDLHAWTEVYLPGAGWIGLDPTSGLFAGEGHIPLACTPEPSSAAPISGAIDECECEFEHLMAVVRVDEVPRVTKPYSEEQWQTIDALGYRIDSDLQANGVHLTMGGEPTFVAVDDPDGDEWNTDALGPTKRLRAADLFLRMRERYAPAGLVHFGQGKWYPGEQLPRWSLNCFWRRDGEPLADPAMFADEREPSAVTTAQAADFLQRVAQYLGVSGQHIFPAYEDPLYYLWRERRLPDNVDPSDSRLEDPLERARLRKVFEQGLGAVIGQVLPLAREENQPWQSGSWFLRSEHCYLLPGDSPLGYRLPLDSQPWVHKSDYPYIHSADPHQPFPTLPAYRQLLQSHASAAENARPQPVTQRPEQKQSADWIARTALCAEPRNGILYLFMPPTRSLEDYLQVVEAIEATSLSLGIPVVLEGYEPPSDPRLTCFRITPDPGVIEVNIQPAASWGELVEQTTFLYDAARQSRLTTEKFMVDGRHTGTGGGNHMVMGGATPAESPFLRRPDVLRSLIGYWHNHPSLSYLFSGLFIGPTSQAPRIDEARNDSVYEMEIAFSRFPEPGEEAQPWLIDRLLRNLLIDSSGNTHRAEFCIDKLYSPDGPSGRLGLLELRAFEMPPHARMSLTQQLLLRALLARFWQQPYQPERLRRWGTELHDRFMLPHFVRQDFNDVLAELREFGYPFEATWFDAHFAFRFPQHGEFSADGVQVQIDHALEPWHVMGEEGASGGTVRYVDSSVERLQIRVTGFNDDRHQVTVNGRPVPLQPTGNVGEAVGAVRYRAWQPAASLHPTIGVHAPLTVELVDTWMQRSLGGCQYHVAHPGGRSHDTHPINAYEAEGRRLARFLQMGHTPGKLTLEPQTRNPNFPFTLDLRWK
ncbi:MULTISPECIES: transglutaminase family protein [unclassified Serratia (in: enterobacteria)]|uniref:transglutaminase family protein n=1 Tax=unclassified Serratia (in: enterobacteria) TaxID=2647522 RepID=UPI002ED4EC6A|nr:transglutaminase family protein [Serratia sp. C2(2)]MEE4445373.1 transglutaminase family protein [Serratia sp. C2(1)]